jgi:aspartate/methionine/tyrosine aminotransferase
MHWAKRTVGRVPWCLGASGVPAPDPDEFPAARSEYAGPNYYGLDRLREAVARAHGVDVERVLITSGTSLANYLLLTTLAVPGTRVLVEDPTYPVLSGIPDFHGATVERFARPPERGWLPDVDAVRRLATRAGAGPVAAIVLTRLHNPTGVDLPPATIEAFASLAEELDCLVLWDEVYLDFLEGAPPAHRQSERFVSTGSLTKVYGFGGLRVGWAIGAPAPLLPVKELSLLAEVDGARPAQETGVKVLAELDRFAARAREIAARGRAIVDDWIASRDDVEWTPPAGGITGFLRLRPVRDTAAFAARLREERGVNVAEGEYFDRPGWIRLSWGRSASVVRGALERLGEALDEQRAAGGDASR